MPHIHAASALLVLSLPYALAVPVAQGNIPNPLLPAFQLLGGKLPSRAATSTGKAATPSPVLNLAAPLSAVNGIIKPSALVNLVAPINALLTPSGVSISVPTLPSTSTGVPSLSSTSISLPAVSSVSIGVPSLSSTSISLPAVSSVSISVPTISSALTSVTDIPSAVVLDGLSASSVIAAVVSSDIAAAASIVAAAVSGNIASVSDVLADLTTTIDVSLPTTAASDISSLTGGVLTSPQVTSSDEPLESTSSELIPDPQFQGGPENQLINPVPNPIVPIPTPIDEDDDDTTETEAAALDGSIPSETVEISEPVPTANTTGLFNSTLTNSSEPITTEAPTTVLLTAPTEDVPFGTSDDFVIGPLETVVPDPTTNTTGLFNGTLTNSTLTNTSEPVVTDEATPILLPVPTDDIFIDPLLPTDDVVIDPNTDLPVETDVPVPEEPGVTDTSSEPVELFNPPKDSVELSTFVRIMQGIADVLSNIFHVIPEEAESTVDDDAADDDTASDTIPGVPEPELNVPDVPVPLVNATDNATILERRQFYGATGATPKLDPIIVSDIMRSVLEIITTIFRQVTQAVPAVANAVPDLPVELPAVIKPSLPTTILPILPTDVPQLDLPTDIDWDDLPPLATELPSVALPSIAIPSIPGVPSLPVLPSLGTALPTDIPIDPTTVLPPGLLADIPMDLPTGVPDDLFDDLPGFAPVQTILPSLGLPTSLINKVPSGVANLPTELPTDLPEDLFGDPPTDLPTDLNALADGVTRLAKRASMAMTAEQEKLLSVINANNAELQEALNQLKALQQNTLRKRQSTSVYAGAEAGFTGPQLFPVILNLIDTLLGIVNGLAGVDTIAPNDLNTLLAGALSSAGGLAPATPVVPLTGLGGLGSLGGLEAPLSVVPVPVASVVPALDGALGSLGGLAAPLVSGVPAVVPSLVPAVDLGALGSLGGLGAAVVSNLPSTLPLQARDEPLEERQLIGGLGGLGGIAGLGGVITKTRSTSTTGVVAPATPLAGALGTPVPVVNPVVNLLGAAVPVASPVINLLGAVVPVASPVVNVLDGLLAGGSVAGLAPIGSSAAPGFTPSPSPSPSPVVNALDDLLAGGSAAGLAAVISPLPLVGGLPAALTTPLPLNNLLPNVAPLPVVSPVAGVVNGLLENTLPDLPSLPSVDPLSLVESLSAAASPVAGLVNGLLDSSLPDLPNVASVLPISSPLPAVLDTVPGTGAVTDTVNNLLGGNSAAGLASAVGDVPGLNGLLGGAESVNGVLGNVSPILDPIPAGIAPALHDVQPLVDPVAPVVNTPLPGLQGVGDVPGLNGLLNGLLPGAESVNGVLGNVSPLVDPLPEGLAPGLHAVQPLVDPVAPLVNNPINGLQGLDPVLALASPVADLTAPLGQNLNPILNAATPLISAATPLINNLVPVATPLAPAASLLGALATPGAQLPGLDTLLSPVVEPLKPVTAAVNSILPEVALRQIQGVLQTLRRLLGIPDSPIPLPFSKRDVPVSVVPVLPQPQIFASLEHDSIESVPDNAAHVVKAPLHTANGKRHEELTRRSQAPAEKRQIFTNAAVKRFLTQWHTIGASMAKVSPQTVNDLMQVFMDPSSYPPTATNLAKYDASLRSFIQSFYIFAQYMDDAGVSPEEKIQMLRIMFDDTSINSGSKKTKRSMRYGRRQLGVAEDGEPDTGPSLDDAEKFGHNALLALLGPQGSLDPLELFRPQDRVYDPIEYDEASTEDSTGATDDSETFDDSASGDDAAPTDDSEPTEEEYADYLDYFRDSH